MKLFQIYNICTHYLNTTIYTLYLINLVYNKKKKREKKEEKKMSRTPEYDSEVKKLINDLKKK